MNLNQKYYRIVRDYCGMDASFEPSFSYEQVRIINDKFVKVDKPNNPIKEVCFAKTVERCFFAIALFLEEGYYYIYETNEEPCIDLSNSNIKDFDVIQEVRYRKPVRAKCIGKLNISDMDAENLVESYRNCVYGDFFDNEYALQVIQDHKEMNNYIECI